MEDESTEFREYIPTRDVIEVGLQEAQKSLVDLGLGEYANTLPGPENIKLFVGYGPDDDFDSNAAFASFIEVEDEGKRVGISIVCELPSQHFVTDYIPEIKGQLRRAAVDFLAVNPDVSNSEIDKAANDFSDLGAAEPNEGAKQDLFGILHKLFTEKTPEALPVMA